MNLTVRDLTRIVKGQLVLGDPRANIESVSIDSRQAEAKSVFFALKGERVDGHDFAPLVVKKNAAAVVVSRVNWLKAGVGFSTGVVQVPDVAQALRFLAQHFRNSFKGPVVGITGSNGKTTTKQMVASVLGTMSPGLYTSGNLNSQIGLPLVLSTLRPEHKWMALEMGASAPGNISSLADMARPTLGIITSIGPAHLSKFCNPFN
jgi:UDP-N-acetylmuramoyl-tripeptide--D-alanyl-D-alanine ligase